MDGESLNISKEKIEQLKQLFPEVLSEDKIDFEKLKLTLGEDVTIANERYVLNWAGKSDAFKVLQTPTTATLAPDKKESINFDSTDNIFIEGENLEVLKVLQKSYYGKIKMIYIDPPYNTGNDSFIYPDKFSETKEEYQKRIGEKDEEGYLLKEGLFRKNSKESGQYHSNWLSMIYPRLFLAKNLLREDGLIFVSIDDNEVHSLRMIMNEIFGEENFIGNFLWRKKAGAGADSKLFFRQHDYIILFGKNTDSIEELFQPLTESQINEYKNPDNDSRGKWAPTDLCRADDNDPKRIYEVISPKGNKFIKCWSYTESNFKELEKENIIWWGKNGDQLPKRKRFLNNKKGLTPRSWVDFTLTSEGGKDLEKIDLTVFDFPKPTNLIKHFLNIGINKEEICMDFFAGSGTTAQAVYELNKEDGGNRKFILVQLPEKTDEDSEAFRAGFKTISDICKERIRRVIKKINDERKDKPELFEDKKLDLGFKVFKLKNSNFKLWRGDVFKNGDEISQQLEVFETPEKDGALEENILYELILKSGYELTSSIEYITPHNIKGGTGVFFSISNGELIIALFSINDVMIKEIIKLKPKKCIILDKLFNGNDQLKTNTVLQMKDAGIEFKTV